MKPPVARPRRTRLALLAILLASATVYASPNAEPVAPPIRTMVGLDQHLGAQLPRDAQFADASGHPVMLGDVLHDRPTVLLFGYFTCPQLCGVTADGALQALRQIEPSVGRDYDLVYISIDPADTPAAAAQKQDYYARRYGRGADRSGWHFLTGESPVIARVAAAAGFRFQPIAGTKQFAHPSGFLVVRPGGAVSRYFPGIDFRPAEIAIALREAAAGHIGQKVFDLLLVCFSGGLRPGFSRWAFLGLQVACGITVVALGTAVGWMLHGERQSRRGASPAETSR